MVRRVITRMCIAGLRVFTLNATLTSSKCWRDKRNAGPFVPPGRMSISAYIPGLRRAIPGRNSIAQRPICLLGAQIVAAVSAPSGDHLHLTPDAAPPLDSLSAVSSPTRAAYAGRKNFINVKSPAESIFGILASDAYTRR